MDTDDTLVALAVADLHGHADMLARIVTAHPEALLVFIAGDLTSFGAADDARAVIDATCADGVARDAIAVAGNCDPSPVQAYLDESGSSAESRALDLGWMRVVGAGAGIRHHGQTPFERDEDALEAALLAGLSGLGVRRGVGGHNAGGQGRAPGPLVVLTHTPPHGTAADLRYGRHTGSRSFAALLAEHAPDLWICGHIHESHCAQREGRTLVLNPGPAAHGRYALLRLGAEGISARLGCIDT